MAIDVLDLTAANVDDVIGHLTISASTSPSTTETNDFIKRCAARVWTALRSLGYGPSSVNSSATGVELELYELARQYVIFKSAAIWMRANENGDPMVAESFSEDAQDIMQSLREYPRFSTGGEQATGFYSSFVDRRSSRWQNGGGYR